MQTKLTVLSLMKISCGALTAVSLLLQLSEAEVFRLGKRVRQTLNQLTSNIFLTCYDHYLLSCLNALSKLACAKASPKQLVKTPL